MTTPSQPYCPYPQPVAASPSQPYYQSQTGPLGYPYYQQPAPVPATSQQAKRTPLLILMAIVVLVAVAGGGYYFLTRRSANVAGVWNMTLTYATPPSRTEDDHLDIQQNGDQLTVVVTLADPGANVEPLTLTGNMSGQDITMGSTVSGCTIRLTGTMSDSNDMAGSWATRCGTSSSYRASGTWSAKRVRL